MGGRDFAVGRRSLPGVWAIRSGLAATEILTLAEDVLTGESEILDDPATIAAGWVLIQGAQR